MYDRTLLFKTYHSTGLEATHQTAGFLFARKAILRGALEQTPLFFFPIQSSVLLGPPRAFLVVFMFILIFTYSSNYICTNPRKMANDTFVMNFVLILAALPGVHIRPSRSSSRRPSRPIVASSTPSSRCLFGMRPDVQSHSF